MSRPIVKCHEGAPFVGPKPKANVAMRSMEISR